MLIHCKFSSTSVSASENVWNHQWNIHTNYKPDIDRRDIILRLFSSSDTYFNHFQPKFLCCIFCKKNLLGRFFENLLCFRKTICILNNRSKTNFNQNGKFSTLAIWFHRGDIMKLKLLLVFTSFLLPKLYVQTNSHNVCILSSISLHDMYAK